MCVVCCVLCDVCCGVVVLWCCGVVVLWCCGVVVLWCCGVVVLWCCGVVVVVVVVVVRMIETRGSLSRRAPKCTLLGGRTPGSKLPASPPPLPRPDGGGTLAVYLCTRP